MPGNRNTQGLRHGHQSQPERRGIWMGAMKNQFGTIGGVFTPCILTILGVIMFMRADFVIGQAGILGATLILLLAISITLLTALSTSAIGTNMKVKGGGAYFLISRVLGHEFGGAIGLLLFFAQAVSVPFYLLGFTEALVRTFPALSDHFLAIGLGTGMVLFVVAYIGAGWAIKMQYLIMATLFGSVFAFFAGAALHFSPERFVENLAPGYTLIEDGEGSYSFWIVFAIYFPAVTGIMAGINMSGDLRDPRRSIPAGTLAAIGVGFIIYLGQILLCGGAFDRADLVEKPYLLLQENALFNAGWLVTAGVFAATLSSALGSILGAPRVLQALSRDKIIPVLNPFARGSRKRDEPRRAMWLVAVMSVGVLLWAVRSPGGEALNIVAGIIAEFFLYTYATLNLAAFIEGAGANPSFRPQFRWFHWSTALAGTLACVAVAFIISPVQAAVAFAILASFVYWIKRRELRNTHGDAWRGFLYGTIRNSLIWLARMEENPKNWRPTCLVIAGESEGREALIRNALWFSANRGLVFIAQVLVGNFEEYASLRATAAKRLRDFCHDHDMEAFPVVVIDQDAEHGLDSVLQSVSVGPIRPSLLIVDWPEGAAEATEAVRGFRMARALDMSVVSVRSGEVVERTGTRRIDVWWRGMKNGSLMALLAHLLRGNPEWEQGIIRVFRVIEDEAGHEGTYGDLREALAEARVNAEVIVKVTTAPLAETIRATSANADMVFLGFGIPAPGEEAAWHALYQGMMPPRATVALVCSVNDMDLDA